LTPLTLNLLAEEQQAEAASARDPVKFAIVISILILLITASVGVWMMMRAEQKRAEADRLQKRWDEMTTKQSGGTFRSLKLFAEDLVSIHQRRMLLAPQLARIKDLMPDSIFMGRMGLRMNTEVTTVRAPAPAEGDAPRATRSQTVEWLLLRLEGTAIGARPEIDVDDFLQTLRTDPVLSNQVREVSLRSTGRTPPGTGPKPKTLMAQFVIECLYKEHK